MNSHVDIRLRPDPEFPAHQLLSALFAKLHCMLSRSQTTTIGVSFPGYGESPITLGDTLRLIGSESDLARLVDTAWLAGVREHAIIAAVAPVPVNAVQRSLRRVQAKSNPERLRRRQMRRHNLTEAEVSSKYDGLQSEQLRLPFVTLMSQSTGQPFKLFLKLGPAESTGSTGCFNAYGLSHTATVPWF